ncbi:MAG: polysaccharide pyruvyl transferase family protein [Clostridiales bacterium]|nr:polysaccharide pyruvyl transferase family protein [Clostridiales bacterium]
MSKYALYFHSGSLNHGCEAIVRSSAEMIKEKDEKAKVKLYTFSSKEDDAANLTEIDEIEEFKFNAGRASSFPLFSINRLMLAIYSRISQTKADEFYYSFSCKNPTLRQSDVYLSIGGDNYCYGDVSPVVALNRLLKRMGKKIVLWGCSIGENDLTPQKVKDLKRYDLIIARESITYETLKKAGITKNIKLCADPAFTLNAEYLPLPEGFIENKTIGLNISPLIMRFEKKNNEGIGMKSMKNLIVYILEQTDYNIAFIPHVASSHSNDMQPLSLLHNMYKDTGRTVLLSNNLNAMQLKGYIARCRAFVGSRAHAAIASYSSKVPTLVLGYSVKAKGMARDIFGSEEGLVLPIQELRDENELKNAFINLLEREEEYRQKLSEVMPDYIKRAKSAADHLLTL